MRLLFICFTKYSYLYLDDSPKAKNNLPQKINPKWDYIVPKNMCFEHNSTSQRKEKYRNVWIYRKRNFALESLKNFIRNFNLIQKQPSKGVVHRKRYSENMQQIYRKTPMPKYDFNKVTLQLYWDHTSALVYSSKFVAYFQSTFF